MPTSAEERIFLRRIVARFRDDAPRLQFADYLDDSTAPGDHARAEFIRLQVALADIPADHPRRAEWTDRQNELLLKYHDEWTRSLKGLADGFEFRRGVVDSVMVEVPRFLARGDELFRRAAIRRVRFNDAGRHMAALADSALLGKVRELSLCGAELGTGGLHILLRSPHLGRLRALDLSFNGLTDSGVRRLAGCRSIAKLTHLYLNDNVHLSGAGMSALAASPHLAALRELDVSANRIGDTGLTALARSRTLARLHTLRVRANGIGEVGCAALAGSDLLGRMLRRHRRLDLRHNAIGPTGVAALAAALYLAAAEELDFEKNGLDNAAVVALVESRFTGRLKALHLRDNQIGDAGAVALARSPLMKQLEVVDVSSNRLTRRGIDELWKHRRDWHTVLLCDGNVPGVSGPSQRSVT
jgi:uncharacterized protein (TIGR02996 family)